MIRLVGGRNAPGKRQRTNTRGMKSQPRATRRSAAQNALPVLLVAEQRRTQERRRKEVVTKTFQCSEATTCSDKMDILLSMFHLQYLRGECEKQSMVRRCIVSLKETLCINTKGKGPL